MRWIVAAAMAASMAGSATAADMSRPVYKAPPAVAAPPFSWSGFYVGGNVGAVRGSSDVAFAVDPAVFSSAAQLDADGSPQLRGTGVTGGLQAGVNWQSGAFVAGLEADINATRVRLSGNVARPVVGGLLAGSVISEEVKSDWLFTLRPRAGIAFDTVLLYATGGLAVANNDFSQTVTFPQSCGPNPCTTAGSPSGTKTGWTAGGGIEVALAPSWSVKAEYLHVDLGRQQFADSIAVGLGVFLHEEHLREDIARVGVNYRFGGPVVARY